MIPIGESNNGKNTGIPCHGIDINPVKKLIIKMAEIIGIVIEKQLQLFNIHIESKSPFSLKIVVLFSFEKVCQNLFLSFQAE